MSSNSVSLITFTTFLVPKNEKCLNFAEAAKLSGVKVAETEKRAHVWLKYPCDRERGRKRRAATKRGAKCLKLRANQIYLFPVL